MGYLEDRLKRKNGILPPLPTKKQPKPIPKVSKKKQAELKEMGKDVDSKLDAFFDEMVSRCTGRCLFCNSKTTAVSHGIWRDDNERWSQEANDRKYEKDVRSIKRASIAHLMPKRPVEKGGFPSVATNENNWIELCWECHTSFDSGKISWLMIRDSDEWKIIRPKLEILLPLCSPEEQKLKLYSKLKLLVYGEDDKRTDKNN